MKHFVSIDIGGTAIKYGMLSEEGRILQRGEMATEAGQGGPAIVGKAMGIVENYQKEEILDGICISTAGMVDTEKGEIFYSAPLIPGYTGTSWKKRMEERFGLPCEVENDVNCAGLAEQISGAARGSKVTLCLTVGTGIGGCILIGDRIFHGCSNSACEVGYLPMFDSDFQTLGASSILCNKVARRKQDKPEHWDGRRIFEEAKSGDVICAQAIDEMAEILGRGIASICYVINPQTVVLGGGIMTQEAFLKPKIQEAVDHYLLPDVASHMTLKMAEHRNEAGMLGAFYHYRSKHGTGTNRKPMGEGNWNIRSNQ